MAESTERGCSRLFNLRELGVTLALVLIIILFSILSPYFFNVPNFINIVRQVSLLGIIAMGMTMVIVCGEIDLSVGSIYGAAGIFTGVMMVSGLPVLLSVLIGLLAGVLFGVANGLLVTFVRIPAMIVTLGMMNMARGLALIVSGGRVVNISPRTVKADGLDLFLFMGQRRIGEVPVMSIVFVISVLVTYFLYNHTLLGFRMRAVGGSRAAARASGINDKLVKIAAFGIVGLLAAIAGQLNISFLGNVQGTTGQGMELNSIAAVIIGGTSLSGGEGTILGTLIGVLIMGVLNNGIVLLGVSPFWQMTIIGAVIVGAVAIDKWTRKDGQA
ncbi:MAG: ABC transporter permease [Planctomycetota bacterium]|jgi:ribose/xylose/arabinose/galactoside ABC-type transport system permease subunit|nr:ABC transporter permease [Planctomycetota bacterium]